MKNLKILWNVLAVLSVAFLISSAAMPTWTAKVFPFAIRVVGNISSDSSIYAGDTLEGNYIHSTNNAKIEGSLIVEDELEAYDAFRVGGGLTGGQELELIFMKMRQASVYDSLLFFDEDSIFKGPASSIAGGIYHDNYAAYRVLISDDQQDTIKASSELTYTPGNLEIEYDGGGATLLELKNYINGAPSPGIITYGYNGASTASYAAVQNNDQLGYWYFSGSESASGVHEGVKIVAAANETWTTGTHGSSLRIQVAYDNGAASGDPATHIQVADSVTTIYHILAISPLASAPGAPEEGYIYVNSSTRHIYCYLNSAWVQLDN